MTHITWGMKLANRTLLLVVFNCGGISDEKLQELIMVKNAEAADWDNSKAEDEDYRKRFLDHLEAELMDQIAPQSNAA